MSNDFRDHTNPYATPAYSATPNFNPDLRQRVQGRVMAPAVTLCVIASLGLLLSLFNVGYALMEHPVDPNANEFMRAMQEGAQGTRAAVIQSCFVAINILILAGAIQMMRFRTWGLALAASILAMINFGTFCCVPGLPVGIWTLVILLTPEVRAAFEAVANQTH
jgi:hypothetical protein